jgi:hypothetical protein
VKLRLCQSCGEKLHYKQKLDKAKETSSTEISQDDNKPEASSNENPPPSENETLPIVQETANPWAQPQDLTETRELTQEEEFEAYFADLLQ